MAKVELIDVVYKVEEAGDKNSLVIYPVFGIEKGLIIKRTKIETGMQVLPEELDIEYVELNEILNAVIDKDVWNYSHYFYGNDNKSYIGLRIKEFPLDVTLLALKESMENIVKPLFRELTELLNEGKPIKEIKERITKDNIYPAFFIQNKEKTAEEIKKEYRDDTLTDLFILCSLIEASNDASSGDSNSSSSDYSFGDSYSSGDFSGGN